jgi:hypothetical protein
MPKATATKNTQKRVGIMTPSHKKWKTFVKRLQGKEGCNFRNNRKEGPGNPADTIWNCSSDEKKPFARKILKDMGLTTTEIRQSLEYFSAHGGYCDCDILFNVKY